MMRITELLTKDTINMNVRASEKDAVITELVEGLHEAGRFPERISSRKPSIDESRKVRLAWVTVSQYPMHRLRKCLSRQSCSGAAKKASTTLPWTVNRHICSS